MRVWGAADDRLVEVVAKSATAFRIAGLPAERAVATRDQIRAALVNQGLVPEAPRVELRLVPPVSVSGSLDLPLALAALGGAGALGARWVFAEGRLGVDGAIYAAGGEKAGTVREALRACQTPLLDFERMFEGDLG